MGVKINGLNFTVVKGNELAGQLGLKDGQQIVGRLLGTSQNEALLQLAGKTIPARMEGTQLAAGTMALFRVSLAANGTVKLKVVAELNGAETVAKFRELTADPRLLPAVCAALQEYGLPVSMENIAKVLENRSVFENILSQPLAPQGLAFLLKQQLPLTMRTILLAWLYQDRDLRNYLWNTLRNSPVVKTNPALLPKVIDLSDVPAGAVQPEVIVNQTPEEAAPGTLGPQSPETLSEGEALQLKTLLEQSANLERLVNASSADGTEVTIPLLVKGNSDSVEEYRVQWREKLSDAAQPERETLIRLAIPTENLGEIHLAMLVSATRFRIGFKVESGMIRDYFLQYLPDLQRALGIQAQIAVSLQDPANNSDSRFDLWM